jgi:hypothetical protein
MTALLLISLLVTSLGPHKLVTAVSPNRPERGKILPSPFDAADMFQAYREIQQDYHTKAFGSGFKTLYRQDGVEVAILEHPDDPTCPYERMQGLIPVSVEDCWTFLKVCNWNRTMPQMDPFYEGASVHGEYDYFAPPAGHDRVHMILCRKRTKRIFAFGKRDLTFLSVTHDDPLEDGTWCSGTVSVRTDDLPRQPGYTRAFQDSIAFYKPVGNGTMCDLTILCRIDLNDSGENGQGGFMPMWLYVKTIGRTGAQSVIRMRNALIREKEKRLSQLRGDNGNTTSQ